MLARLLADELTGTERDTVETHVEICVRCQGELESLSGPTRCKEAPAGVGARAPEPEPGAAFLSRLRQLPPPRLGDVQGTLPPPPSDAGGQRAAPDASWGGAVGAVYRRLGQYEILGKLGKGGMGAVFKARHTELGKVVALKVLPVEEMDELSIARFKNEIRAIGKLDHPNIVAAHDAGESRGVHFLAMELVDGMDLARVVDRDGRLSVADACEAVRQAAGGLQHAYEQGLIHRDIKPSNLMLARDGRVRLLDLGLARSFGEAATDTLTAKGTLLGTADYLAPEQWDHPHAADTRADIYSLGCTLFHLLVGHPPFADGPYQSLLGKMRAHREVAPAAILSLRPEAPAGLGGVLDRMLAKDPARRFATPAEATAALRPFAAGADLGRLLAAGNAAPGPNRAADAATPAPGAWETAPERVGLWRQIPAPARRRAASVALVGLCLTLAAAAGAWLWFGTPQGAAEKPLTVTDMRVIHYRDKGKALVGDLRTSPAVVRLNDNVRVIAELNVPAYYYLIALNPRDSEASVEQLCQPEGEGGFGAEGSRPDRRAEVQYPRDSHDFILDAAGLQAFVLAASTRPLPPYKEWRSRAGALPWEGAKDGGAWRWHFDGRAFTRFPEKRGRVEPRDQVPEYQGPESLQKLCDFFAKRAEFEVVQMVAFPVGEARK
jgi:tRNA A-37 threonylcarbamoyl transferase component Bud32